MRLFPVCFLLFCSLLSAFVSADALTAREWLDRGSHAFKELNYDGVFIYRQGEQINTLRVLHANINGIENEKLIHLDQELREIVRRGHEITCVHPGDQMVRLDHSIPSGLFAKAFGGSNEKIEQSYQLRVVMGQSRVAGRDVVEIFLKPKDNYRYGYRVWFDKETGLLLKSHLLNNVNQVLEGFQFTQVDVGGVIAPALLQPSSEGHIVAHHQVFPNESQEDTTSGHWGISWLPNGFVMAAQDIRRGSQVQLPMNTLMYTDGLSVFSVFIEGVTDSPHDAATSFHGATVAVSRDVKIGKGVYMVTVVGEIPALTATKIADSVIFEK